MQKNLNLKSVIVLGLVFTFLATSLGPLPVCAQGFSVNELPVPGTMVGESAPFSPLTLKGLVVNLQKPLEFQFIVDTGKGSQDTASIKYQANQLVKYFLAGLTIPDGDLWVNLSPYEKNRMVPAALGQTDLGRDLLAQDYILKQLTASLIYPEKDLGKKFWGKVYARAQQQFGTTNIPVNTFNKVWILPDQAQVFEHGAAAYVTKATLKVMLDEDYTALQKHVAIRNGTDSIGASIVRQIVIPEITKEVNTGKNFAPLRQIYQALILAKWYKETIQNGLLDAVYTNRNKVAGVNLNDPAIKEQIYERYLKAYKKGAFNYIKEDPTPDGQVVPRKYFSGGFTDVAMIVKRDGVMSAIKYIGSLVALTVSLYTFMPTALAQSNNSSPIKDHVTMVSPDKAMNVEEKEIAVLTKYNIRIWTIPYSRKRDFNYPGFEKVALRIEKAIDLARKMSDEEGLKTLLKWKDKDFAGFWGNLVRDKSTGKVGLIIGNSNSGKTTLSYYLSINNFEPLGDDQAAILINKEGRLEALGSQFNENIIADRPGHNHLEFVVQENKQFVPVDFLIYLKVEDKSVKETPRGFIQTTIGALAVNPNDREVYLKAIDQLKQLVLDHSGIQKEGDEQSIENEVRRIKEWLSGLGRDFAISGEGGEESRDGVNKHELYEYMQRVSKAFDDDFKKEIEVLKVSSGADVVQLLTDPLTGVHNSIQFLYQTQEPIDPKVIEGIKLQLKHVLELIECWIDPESRKNRSIWGEKRLVTLRGDDDKTVERAEEFITEHWTDKLTQGLVKVKNLLDQRPKILADEAMTGGGGEARKADGAMTNKISLKQKTTDKAKHTALNDGPFSAPGGKEITQFFNQIGRWEQELHKNGIQLPDHQADIHVVLIGPGSSAEDLDVILRQYPNARRIDVIDSEDITRQIEEIKNKYINRKLLEINFFKKNIADMNSGIEGADVVLAFNVFDQRTFELNRLRQISTNIRKMLKPSGKIICNHDFEDGGRQYGNSWLKREFKIYHLVQVSTEDKDRGYQGNNYEDKKSFTIAVAKKTGEADVIKVLQPDEAITGGREKSRDGATPAAGEIPPDAAMRVIQKVGVGTNVSWEMSAKDFPYIDGFNFLKTELPIGDENHPDVKNYGNSLLTMFYDAQGRLRLLNVDAVRKFIKKENPKLSVGDYDYQIEEAGVRIFNRNHQEVTFSDDKELHRYFEWSLHSYLTVILSLSGSAINGNDKNVLWDSLKLVMNKLIPTDISFTKDHIVWQAAGGVRGIIERSSGRSYMQLPSGERKQLGTFESQLRLRAKFALAIARHTLSGQNVPVTSLPSDLNYDDILPEMTKQGDDAMTAGELIALNTERNNRRFYANQLEEAKQFIRSGNFKKAKELFKDKIIFYRNDPQYKREIYQNFKNDFLSEILEMTKEAINREDLKQAWSILEEVELFSAEYRDMPIIFEVRQELRNLYWRKMLEVGERAAIRGRNFQVARTILDEMRENSHAPFERYEDLFYVYWYWKCWRGKGAFDGGELEEVSKIIKEMQDYPSFEKINLSNVLNRFLNNLKDHIKEERSDRNGRFIDSREWLAAHERLGVPLVATMEQVQKAYTKLARQYHPDLVQNIMAEEIQKIFSPLDAQTIESRFREKTRDDKTWPAENIERELFKDFSDDQFKLIVPLWPRFLELSNKIKENLQAINAAYKLLRDNLQFITPSTSEAAPKSNENRVKTIGPGDSAMKGGIDLNQINVKRTGKTISVQFDQAQLSELEQLNFKGFTPVITGFRYIQSPFSLLGINAPAKEAEELAKA